ncbi:MAG: DUF4912 domain-containing protein [Methylococcales bacterium]|nr:DUF4912 domain-containing protein [Methylococcales bacterium]
MTLLQSAASIRIELSQPELCDISQAISRAFSPCFMSRFAELRFSAQELLAVSQEISRDFAPQRLAGGHSLVLLPVDPRHLHVYWRLAEPRREPDAGQPLTLRLFPGPERPPALPPPARQENRYFDIVVKDDQHRLQVELPAGGPGVRYQAALGRLDAGREFTAYAYSNPADMPFRQPPAETASLSAPIARFVLPGMVGSSPTDRPHPAIET